MKTSLIIESGSTKADWLFYSDSKILQEIQTLGLNPKISTKEKLENIISETLLQSHLKVDEIFFYGAGIIGYEEILIAIFNNQDPGIKIIVQSDLIAAANASFSLESRLVCILGTGSFIGKFRDNKLVDSRLGHGYLIGDICSGSEFGKKILRDFRDQMLPSSLGSKINLNPLEIHSTIYQKEAPNRFLASFFPLLVQDKTNPYSSHLFQEQIELLYKNGIEPLLEINLEKISFIGGVANQLQEELQEKFSDICPLEFIERPISQLFRYHLSK